jgi:hypothetical protein
MEVNSLLAVVVKLAERKYCGGARKETAKHDDITVSYRMRAV